MKLKSCITYILLIVLLYCIDSLPANLIGNDDYKIVNDASSIITESIESKYIPDKDVYMEESIKDSVTPTNELAKDATAGATAKAATPDSNSASTKSSPPSLLYRNEPIIFTPLIFVPLN